ncbi:aminoglycoside phosphotransferase family protein [Deinococcus navajonensis]|uniref:Aminoglycoside phosphotransferase family protein n=1 Tax=Deinococcus navajonensis TaxID=309884 RepID=A0ABV8XSB2_9DEIO
MYPNTASQAPVRLHADEVHTDVGLVGRLLQTQFLQWAHLPLTVFASAGSDHVLYRLGEDLAVRLPRRESATGQTEQDLIWLPRLAPALPLAVPEPLALGQPGEGFPWTWGIYRWLPGEPAFRKTLSNLTQAARDLARFIQALQAADPADGPVADPASLERGAPLRNRDAWTRENIGRLPDDLDHKALTTAWEAALQAPDWPDDPVWLHGDLQSGNLLAHEGRLRAVIDFGSLRRGIRPASWRWPGTGWMPQPGPRSGRCWHPTRPPGHGDAAGPSPSRQQKFPITCTRTPRWWSARATRCPRCWVTRHKTPPSGQNS